jgi:hypothetical protein
MDTNTIVFDAPAAACRLREGLDAAPRFAAVLGSESAYVTLSNPIVGTDVMGAVGVRDAKQAAPPRGELR